jgi:hypothetical protein
MNLLRVAVKTLIKVFDLGGGKDVETDEASLLIIELISCKFDDISIKID